MDRINWRHATPEHVKQTLARRDFLRHAGGGLATVAAFSGLFTLPGCGSGGGGKSGAKGAIALQIVWPTKTTRFIPLAANSIVVTVKEAGSNVKLATATVTRPKTSLTMSEIPPGTATVTAVAYASSDGTGTPLASGTSGSVTVVASQTSPVRTITMATSVANVSVTSSASEVDAKKTCTLTASATDIDGATVLVAPSVWKWTSGNEAIATVSGSGTDNTATATGIGNGSVAITATDAEDSLNVKAGTARLRVKGAAQKYRVGWNVFNEAKLFTADLDGTNQASVALLGTWPEFSGDGSKYLYSNNGDYLARVGATSGTIAPSGARNCLNYDGTRMVWAKQSETNGPATIYSTTIDWSADAPTFGATIQLTPSGWEANYDSLALSGDGSTVVYSSFTSINPIMVKTDGTGLTDLTTTYGLSGSTPFVTVDGSWVGVWTKATPDYWSLSCMPATGGVVNSWSTTADGNYIHDFAGFVRDTDQVWWSEAVAKAGTGVCQFLCNKDGSNVKQIASDALSPCYSPDAKYVSYGRVVVVNADQYISKWYGIRVKNLDTGVVSTMTENSSYYHSFIYPA